MAPQSLGSRMDVRSNDLIIEAIMMQRETDSKLCKESSNQLLVVITSINLIIRSCTLLG